MRDALALPLSHLASRIPHPASRIPCVVSRASALRATEPLLYRVDRRAQRRIARGAAGVERGPHILSPRTVRRPGPLDRGETAAEPEAVELPLAEEACPVIVVAHRLVERVGKPIEPRDDRTRGCRNGAPRQRGARLGRRSGATRQQL